MLVNTSLFLMLFQNEQNVVTIMDADTTIVKKPTMSSGYLNITFDFRTFVTNGDLFDIELGKVASLLKVGLEDFGMVLIDIREKPLGGRRQS